MSNKEITGYLYRNGMWHETYKNHPKKPVSEDHVIEHYKNNSPDCKSDNRGDEE